MVRFYKAAPVVKIWKNHALVRFVMDLERALTKNLRDIDTEQMREARRQLLNLEPTDVRLLVVSALDEMLEGAGTAFDGSCGAGMKSEVQLTERPTGASSPHRVLDMSEPQKTIHYFSTLRGFRNQGANEAVVYYGAIVRIPAQEYATEEATKNYEEPLLDKLEEKVAALGVPEGAIIERYDTWDWETGDVLVLYRIPGTV